MKRVLIVDDSLFWRELVSDVVKSEGHEVVIAKDGLDGYNKAFEFVPDIVFTDIEMPQMKGYTLCRLLKNEDAFKKAGIIIMTSLGETLTRFWASTAGADGFIQKGGNPEELAKAIKMFLRKDYRARPELIDKNRPHKFEEINYLLENIILRETIRNEVYSLYSYISDEEHIFWRLADLIFQVVPVSCLAILTLDPQEGRFFVSAKGKKVNGEGLRKKLFSVFSRPIIPMEWKVMGDGIGGSEVPQMFPFIFRDRQGKEIGVLGVEGDISDVDVNLLHDIVYNLGELFKLTMSYSAAIKQARYDELTGLLNFRALMERLTEYFSLSRRSRSPISIGVIDIDNFKKVNDTYGHLVGNDVLKELAKIMKSSFREVDIIGRYGGEEFVVGMANTPIENAKIAFERFRRNVEQHNWEKIQEGLKITVSIGVASTQDGKSYRTVVEMIEDADAALYEAKQSGKNMVKLAS